MILQNNNTGFKGNTDKNVISHDFLVSLQKKIDARKRWKFKSSSEVTFVLGRLTFCYCRPRMKIRRIKFRVVHKVLLFYHIIYPIQIVLCQNTIYFAVQQIKIMHRASYDSFGICSSELLLKTGCRKVQSN